MGDYTPTSDGFPNDEDAPALFSSDRVVGDIYPVGADQPGHRIIGTRGGGWMTTNADPNTTGVDPLTGEDAPLGTDVGFADPIRRYLWAGLYNGSFSEGPFDPDQAIDDSNYLPYWRWVEVSGTSVIPTWSSGSVTLALGAGAAGDDAAFEQLHRINTSDYQAWAYAITGYVSSSTTASANAYLEGQFLTATLATTGSAVRTEADSGKITVVMGATPTDAVYLRVRFGIERDALATSGTASRTWSEVNVHPAPDVIYLSNATERAASISATGTTGYFMLRTDALATARVELEAEPDVASPVRVKNESGVIIAAATVGLTPYAYPVGVPHDATSGGAANLDTVAAGLGGARAIPILVPSMMLVESLSIWSTDTANARAAEWALFWDRAEAGTNNLISVHDPLIGSAMGTFSFTPGAASVRTSTASGGPYRIAPGLYWLVIRNTSTARTFGIGYSSAGTLSVDGARSVTNAASLTITVDISTWTDTPNVPLVRLNGRIGAETAAF